MLEVIGLSKRFGGLAAVADVSFNVKKGQIKAIIGPNGAGKTTCLNLISGLYKPTSGEIKFNNQTITHLAPHRRAYLGMGRTFQNIRLFEAGMRVLENVIAGRHVRGQTGIHDVLFRYTNVKHEYDAATDEALRWLDFVGLLPKAYQQIGALTFVEQRALELARALAMEPELLLLDELASGLNETEAEEFSRQILRIREELGITVCLVEHNMNLVMSIADEILVLDFGRCLAEGTCVQIQNNADVIKAYLGDGIYA